MTLDEITKHLAAIRNLKFLREKTDNVSNKLYLFTENGSMPQFVLKGLLPNDFEIEAYSKYLPKIKNTFQTLVIPQVIDQYSGDNLIYLLLPYYNGTTFDFNPQDMDLANQLVDVAKELSSIDVESVIVGGNNFDFQTFETRFWEFFDQAITLGLVTESVRDRCLMVLKQGRANQRMIIVNGDFNPRNVIRFHDGKMVLIDWNGIVFPLEHILTYPWLLNWQNPSWQRQYASKFETELPVEKGRMQMHLMNIALQRAVGEKGHHNDSADNMAQNHMKNFNAGLDGFTSLVDLCG